MYFIGQGQYPNLRVLGPKLWEEYRNKGIKSPLSIYLLVENAQKFPVSAQNQILIFGEPPPQVGVSENVWFFKFKRVRLAAVSISKYFLRSEAIVMSFFVTCPKKVTHPRSKVDTDLNWCRTLLYFCHLQLCSTTTEC